jgi:hypothetical protein
MASSQHAETSEFFGAPAPQESYLAGMAGMGAGGKAAWSEAQLQRLLRVRAAQEERRQERVARLRRTGS